MLHTRIQSAASAKRTVAQVIADVLGEEAAASYRPSGHHPSAAHIAASAHDAHMAEIIHDMGVAYAARGHAK